MLGRRKNREAQGAGGRQRPDPAALSAAMTGVLKAFLHDPPTGGGPARDDGFVFNIAPVTGAESSGPRQTGVPNIEVPVPGVGMVSATRLAAMETQLQQTAARLGLDPNMANMLDAGQAQTALDRLHAMRGAGEITDEQEAAVAVLIQTVTASPTA